MKNLIEEFKIAKTPHLFQIKIRDLAKQRYDELEKTGMPRKECIEIIKNELNQIHKELNTRNNVHKARYLKVLKKAAEGFMQEKRFPPNVGYSDALESEASEPEKEKISPAKPVQDLQTAYILTRGIGYKASKFDQFARTWHRSYSEGSMRPNYSISAVLQAINEYNKTHGKKLNLGDYFKGKYDNNKTFIALTEFACKKISDDFRFLRNEKFSLEILMPVDKDGEILERKQLAPIYLLQDIYTNDMTIFLKMVDKNERKIFRENYQKTGHPFGNERSAIDVLNRNGVLAKQNPETFMQLLNLLDGQDIDFHKEHSSLSVSEQITLINLDNTHSTDLEQPHIIDYDSNPFTSTGYTNKAAFDYAMENKTYGSYLLQEFFPNYDTDLVPEHPFIGKLYGFMMSEDQYNNYVAESAMNVVQQHNNRKLHISETIIDENEMTFIGGCLVTEKPQIKVSEYPKLKKDWNELSAEKKAKLKREYGLDEASYNKLKIDLKVFNDPARNPAYLRDKFAEEYSSLLNLKNVPKDERFSTVGQPWSKEDVFTLIAKDALNKDVVEATLKNHGGFNDEASQNCINTLNEYSKNKKLFHAAFKNVYEHMLDKFEEESVDFALKRGYKIANLSEQGKNYQNKRIIELAASSISSTHKIFKDKSPLIYRPNLLGQKKNKKGKGNTFNPRPKFH